MDLIDGFFLVAMLFLPPVLVCTSFFFMSGEVMSCDSDYLQFARRRMWGGWRRQRFPASEVRGIRSAVRTRGKSSFTVLTFEWNGRSFDMFEDLDRKSSSSVLATLREMGLDVTFDPAAVMLDDIAERGWLINPWKKD
jgi:hypothetical protein